jgi:hypothetical protein
MRRLCGLGATIVLALLLLCSPSAYAADTDPVPSPTPSPVPSPAQGVSTPTTLCTLADPILAQLSGLAVDGQGNRWAISGSGSSVRVYLLGTNCSVRTVLAAAIKPNDLQDLAFARNGTLWLADIGDESHSRSTVAMIILGGPGVPSVHRLRYPDGPHDAKAMLLGSDGVPLIITAEPNGPAGVYRPVRSLTATVAEQPADSIPLLKVGEVALPASNTGGGPVGAGPIVTGGATTADGRVVALRTYTDAWLFAAPDGDLVTALKGRPVQVPLPAEPKGEAIAFDQLGNLLAGSASPDGSSGQLVQVTGAAALAGGPGGASPISPASSGPARWAAAPDSGDQVPAERTGASPLRRWLLFGAAGVLLVVAIVVVIVGLVAARRRNDPWRSDATGEPLRPGGPSGRPRAHAGAAPVPPGWPGAPPRQGLPAHPPPNSSYGQGPSSRPPTGVPPPAVPRPAGPLPGPDRPARRPTDPWGA